MLEIEVPLASQTSDKEKNYQVLFSTMDSLKAVLLKHLARDDEVTMEQDDEGNTLSIKFTITKKI